jgi:hypothetical protein
MATFSLDSQTVTIGAGQTTTTWGDPIVPVRVADPGYPLLSSVNIPGLSPSVAWRHQPSLRKVVEFAARNIATVPWKVFRRVDDNDRRRVSNSPAEVVLRTPRPRLTDWMLKFRIAVDWMLYDRWCVALVEGQLQRVPARALVIESDEMDNVTRIGVQLKQGVVDLSGLPLAFSTGWSAWNGDGTSPLTTLSEILNEQRRAVEWRAAQWNRGPKFDGIVTRPADAGKWDPDKRKRWLESFRDFRDGKAGGTPIFEDGMDFKDLSGRINPADAKDIEGRQLTDQEVASAFHIPPELVGARQGNFSNIAAFRQMLFGPTLGPVLEQMQQAFNAEIVPALDDAPGTYAVLDREAAMNGSFLEQAQYLQTAVGASYMTRAEARSRLDMPFIAGTDELVTPLNVLTGGLASPTDTGSQNLGGSGKALRRKLHAVELRQLESAKAETGKSLAATLREVYERQWKEVSGKVDAAEFHKQWDQVMADAVHPHLWRAALAGAKSVLNEYNPSGDGWAEDVMRPYVAAMARGTASKLNDGVISAADDLDDVPEDEQDDQKVGLLDRLRNSTAIAWGMAAVADAAGFGRQDAAGASGLVSKTWFVTSDNPRPSHAAMNGETVGMDETFSNGLRWPGDGQGEAGETAGCTCQLEYAW